MTLRFFHLKQNTCCLYLNFLLFLSRRYGVLPSELCNCTAIAHILTTVNNEYYYNVVMSRHGDAKTHNYCCQYLMPLQAVIFKLLQKDLPTSGGWSCGVSLLTYTTLNNLEKKTLNCLFVQEVWHYFYKELWAYRNEQGVELLERLFMTVIVCYSILITSDTEVDPKCEGTLCDDHSRQPASYQLQSWAQLLKAQIS